MAPNRAPHVCVSVWKACVCVCVCVLFGHVAAAVAVLTNIKQKIDAGVKRMHLKKLNETLETLLHMHHINVQ